ncbi:MAG: hypothetical protein ACRDN8_20440, partial [Thermoleophilaceae bacterium]
GMGKTSLAVRAAYDCPLGQFQRIIFLSVKDRELDDDGERKLTAFILPGLLEMLNEARPRAGAAGHHEGTGRPTHPVPARSPPAGAGAAHSR